MRPLPLLALMVLAALPLSASAKQTPILRYDLTYAERWAEDPARLRDAWDHAHVVAALQGIVNRHAPTFYLRAVRNPEGGNIRLDDWWLAKLQSKGAWLHNRPVVDVPNLDALIARFRHSIHGLVVYDESVPATSNVASTIAGVDDVLPIRFDETSGSLYRHLTDDLHLPVKTWLVHPDGTPKFTGRGTIPDTGEPSSGSAKNDAYRWAIKGYLETGRCKTEALAYYIDAAWLKQGKSSSFWNSTLTNHDYFISRRSFFFDLSPWDDEPASDDPTQKPGADLETLKRILLAAAHRNGQTRMTHLGGFIPWAFKYTDSVGGKHGGVATEWKFVEIISGYNAYLDADALGLCGLANASFYAHQTLPDYPRERPRDLTPYLTPSGVAPKPYVTFYVGDFDSAAWLYQMLPSLWDDPKRGSVPMGWAFNPNLAERFPAAFWYTRATRSKNDTFVAGDSGAGYVNPSLLEAPRAGGLPSAVGLWERHNKACYTKFGLGITGFIIDGNAPPMPDSVLDAYARFSPDGIVAQKVPPAGLHNGVPVLRMGDDLPSDPAEAARLVLSRLGSGGPSFKIFRAILKKPSWYAEVAAAVHEARPDVEILDPYTFMALVKRSVASPPMPPAL